MYEYRAIVKGVYDGDTVKVDLDQGFSDWKHDQTLRLYGVNTPELKGESREEGVQIRDFVRGHLGVLEGGRWGSSTALRIKVETKKDRSGKYGRWLAVVWYLDISGVWVNLNQQLIEMGHPCPADWL